MDPARARSLLTAERADVQRQLADLAGDRTQEHDAEQELADSVDPAQALVDQSGDDAVAASLRDRLGALERALQRVEDGGYGQSVRSGVPIPDERLEADPAAELTVDEAESSGR